MSTIRTETTTTTMTDAVILQDHDYSNIQDSDNSPIYITVPLTLSTQEREEI